MSNSDPLVLIIMPLAEQRGGAELSLLQLIGARTGMRWHVVFLEDGPMLQQCRELGVPATVILSGRARQPHRMIAAVWRIARLARREKASAILGWMAKAHLYGGLAARFAGIPAGWFQHGLPTAGSWIDGSANRIPAAGAMACSGFSADAQLRLTPKLKMRVVHPAADLSRFNPDLLPMPVVCRSQLNLPQTGPLIGIFGRLQSWKGMHVLIDAMPRVLANHADASAVIVGGAWNAEQGYEGQLRQRAAQLKLESRVIFAGHQLNVSHWMQACDVVVHASQNEPFGMVVVEAMALGKPVVAGDSGGPREALTDGETGLLTPFGDAVALADAILKYLDDPAFAHSIGNRARSRAQDFSVERFAHDVSEAVRDWIGSDARGSAPATAEVAHAR